MTFSTSFSGLTIGPEVSVKLMGVLNLSPESFYQHSVVNSMESLKSRIERFLSEGVHILDLGPKSTAPVDIYGRPTVITAEEEIERLKRPLTIINEYFSDRILISVDTQSSKVAEYALKNGCSIINDISGFRANSMMDLVIERDVGVVIMPAKEKPGDIYKPFAVKEFFKEKLSEFEKKGGNPKKVILDPGVGGWIPERTPTDDYNLIKELKTFRIKENSLLMGISRKSFIGAILNAPPEERLYGSLAATAVAVINGADVIRTHDIGATRDAIKIAEMLR